MGLYGMVWGDLGLLSYQLQEGQVWPHNLWDLGGVRGGCMGLWGIMGLYMGLYGIIWDCMG